MSHIYHGCFRKNADGTNRIIANDEDVWCLAQNLFRNILRTYLSVKDTQSVQEARAC